MTRPRLFGTDGIRAPFGEAPLDQETVTRLGHRLGQTLVERATDPLVVLGGDTRDSTPTLCRWMAAGLGAAGARVRYVGVVPTPGVAYLVAHSDAAGGVAVSASHNPWPDNGIKLFDAAGFKWAPAAEAALEQRLEAPGPELPTDGPELHADPGALAPYLAFLRGPDGASRPLAGLRLVLDTANGATSAYAGDLFRGLGAEVEVIGDAPDGQNINQGCGSTHPEALQKRVRAEGCDAGIAFDGDGDRALLVDDTGALRDGDAMLYLWARDLASRGRLEPRKIVATSMSNLGLERALAAENIAVVRCDVGDREVVRTMREEGAVLGGEQSGHLVSTLLSTTGDGLLTARTLLGILAAAGAPLSHLLAEFRRFPQVLHNVQVSRKPPLDTLPAVQDAAAAAERELGAEGRLVLRYSGTEPLARIMLEGPDQEQLERLAESVAAAIRQEVA